MPAGIWFWIIYVLCVVFGLWAWWPAAPPQGQAWGGFRPLGGILVIFILIGLLGWEVFGPPLK